VTAGTDSFCHNLNGDMTSPAVGVIYTLTYDTENHLTGVRGGASASFVYDGDGNRVKATFGDSTTVYVGSYYEQTGAASTKYYYAGSQRIALRRSDYASDNGLFWLLTDHLGSTAITADSGGTRVAELRYKAWGENRYTYGATPTTYRFTGQRLDESTGLMYYGARYYDPTLGRFVQADTIVPNPGNPQDLNRYAYVRNNPLRYIDPSGHQGEPWWKRLVEAADSVTSKVESLAVDVVDSLLPDSNWSHVAAWQGMALGVCWFWEIPGTEVLRLGPESPLTQEVMHDPALDEFREEWKAAGYPSSFSRPHEVDERTGLLGGAKPFLVENAQLFLALIGFGSETPEGQIDAIGGILGSFDEISVFAEDGWVRFQVLNTMGWASATRIPGTDWSLLEDRYRSEWGPGGTTSQYFYWWEPMPCPPYCSSYD